MDCCPRRRFSRRASSSGSLMIEALPSRSSRFMSTISTGGSGIEVVDALREADAEVLGIVSIFTYGMKKGLERLAAADVKNVSLTNLDVLSEVAAQEGYIKPEDVNRLIAFRNNPSDESWIGGAK